MALCSGMCHVGGSLSAQARAVPRLHGEFFEWQWQREHDSNYSSLTHCKPMNPEAVWLCCSPPSSLLWMPKLGDHVSSPLQLSPQKYSRYYLLIHFRLLNYFPLTSDFWIYSFGLIWVNHCLCLADIFNVRTFASLSPWTQTSRGKTLTEKSCSIWHRFIGIVGAKRGLPCEETSEFPVVRGLCCKFSESRLWFSQRLDIVRSEWLETWCSWNPRLLGKSKRFLLSRTHIVMPYESLRILVYFHQLRYACEHVDMDHICYMSVCVYIYIYT
jgi:hypothetical protein